MDKEDNIILPAALGLLLLYLFSQDNKTSGGCPDTGPVIGLTPTNFVIKYWPAALYSQKHTTIPAIFTLTQGGLESNWGKSAPGNNLFGIHADKAWTGKKILALDAGRPTLFRAYNNACESFIDHGRFFIDNKRYRTALQHVNDSADFAKAIAAAGYAEDPNYAPKLIDNMKTVVGVLQSHKII